MCHDQVNKVSGSLYEEYIRIEVCVMTRLIRCQDPCMRNIHGLRCVP